MNDNQANQQLNLTDFSDDIEEVLHDVKKGKPILLNKDGKEVAAIISIEDLRLLERLIEEEEDRIDSGEASEILSEVKEQGTVTWESLKASIGL
jgi:prevent-host-death family protein